MTPVEIALTVLAGVFALAMIRALRGPTLGDRAVAADICLYVVIAAIALLALRSGAEQLLDVVLVATLLGFLATIALSVLVGRRGS